MPNIEWQEQPEGGRVYLYVDDAPRGYLNPWTDGGQLLGFEPQAMAGGKTMYVPGAASCMPPEDAKRALLSFFGLLAAEDKPEPPEADAELEALAQRLFEEVREQRKDGPPMRSRHEGYAHVLESVDVLRAYTFAPLFKPSPESMRDAALCVAVMAMRFALDAAGVEPAAP